MTADDPRVQRARGAVECDDLGMAKADDYDWRRTVRDLLDVVDELTKDLGDARYNGEVHRHDARRFARSSEAWFRRAMASEDQRSVDGQGEDSIVHDLMKRIEDVEAERDSLQQWKRDAAEVMMGLQDLGKVLGVPPGKRITGEDGVRAAEALRVDLHRAWDDGWRAGNLGLQREANNPYLREGR